MPLDDHPRRWNAPPGSPPWSDQPPAVDSSPSLAPWLEERLFDRRIVILQGTINGAAATRTAAALLTLDAQGPDPVELHLRSPDGDLDAVFAVIDALDVMHAPVHALATSEIGGAAIGLYAVAPSRKAFPHTRFRLREPRAAGVSGTAEDVAHAAGHHLRALDDLIVRISEATGQPRSRIEDDLSRGRQLTAEEAREYGLVHEIVAPGKKPDPS
ncbi:ATP-dependent Clp protease proteolytic subunit [Asanoa siamensis]|uniref:ATP-dependent Clp protease proteolytic subunit n=1 Tax=Asanoa siamensis TaxID=926357 RepID=A0ABQ4CSR2_9ACTN|nr:ATP-dependent Clp protease proteolytic subunit [Asanoa siamensis]GIF74313.1 ATP-dependent Clp protease proteolytic subunit [Asanoa siamensis]